MGILKISEALSLAIHGLSLLALEEGDQEKVKDLASKIGVSKAHLAKVLQQLVKAGILYSTRGPKGGFVLAKQPEKITLLEIYQAVEGPLREEACLLQKEVCPFSRCIFGDFLPVANRQFREYLAQRTLADVRQK
ncbi:MAG: RrF2 family transcriptional regulator [Candidatus Caldatribacteriaceae bacterium]